MKKYLLISSFCLLASCGSLFAQDKYFTRKGHITFYSHTPVEDIEAFNRDVSSVLDTQTGRLEFATLMKAFQFKKALMQEHFNENYVESSKYPKASFKGQITNWENVDLSRDGEYPVQVKGELTIKDRTQPLETEALLVVANGILKTGTAEFYLKPADFNISIPALVRENIAEEIQVRVNIPYEPLTP